MTSDSGLAVIRSAVLVRAKKSQLANLARNLGTGSRPSKSSPTVGPSSRRRP